MKYGDTLQQRSIPEWETYNVDYNDIKRLIKARTTKTQTHAKSIPGHSDDDGSLRAFEDELYSELCEQHQRIDLFVKSKSGEITRRLNHLKNKISQTEKQNRHVDLQRISVRRLEKASRVEEEVLKAGEEIQSLSRFVGAQRLAFQKLLKKYQRWTSSQELARRFTQEVIGRQTSFVNTDFNSLLNLWTEVLARVRAPFESAQWAATSGTTPRARRSSQSAAKHGQDDDSNRPGSVEFQEACSNMTVVAELDRICRNGTDVDLDTALAVLPLGQGSGRTVYWIHSDNVVELHVLLLQYMKIRGGSNSTSNSGLPSLRASREGSMEGGAEAFEKDSNDLDELIVCDDLHRYVKQCVGEEPSDSENVILNTLEAAVTIRVTSSGEAVVAVGPHPEKTSTRGDSGSSSSYQTLKVKRKALGRLFDPGKAPLQSQKDSAKAPHLPEFLEAYQRFGEDFERVQEWLRKHKEVQPLVKIQHKRTRYFGLKNDQMHGIWCSLDQDITMRKLKHDRLFVDPSSAIEDTQDTELETFPYAVLDVTWNGNGNADVIQALDKTHLTKRIDGFALESHAIFTLCKPEGVPPPFWLPTLQQDIRKLPSKRQKSRRHTSQTQQSSESANTQPTSTSANSIFDNASSNGPSNRHLDSPSSSVPDLLESAPLSAFHKKRQHPHRKHPLCESVHSSLRYWNEYDDPPASDENSTYRIFIDPSASTAFPGWRTVTTAFHSLFTNINLKPEKILSHLTPQSTNEDRPLLFNHEPDHPFLRAISSHTSMSSSSTSRSYKTFPSRRSFPVKIRETLLLRSCIASFLVSYLLLLITFVLVAIGILTSASAVRSGLVLGVVFSVLFAAVGVGCALARREKGGWMRWVGLGLLVVGIVVGWVVLGVVLGGL